MAFAGNVLNSCDANLFRFQDAYIVIVSGIRVNPCGHALLNLGGRMGHYIHIDGIHSEPKYMTYHDYNKYLILNDKTELYREPIIFSMPWRALGKLEELVSKKWRFGFVFHNCATFVEQIVKAGGGDFSVKMNCPKTVLPEGFSLD